MQVIIVAGGAGSRMKSDIPKQFIELSGKPILIHSIMAFAEFYEGSMPIVVLCPSQLEIWTHLCKLHNFKQAHRIVAGGKTRFHSVKNGLEAITDCKAGLVAVHDAVRPLVSKQTIIKCINDATKYGCAIPAIAVADTVREVFDDNTSKMLNRASLRLIQTPQIFDLQLLKNAYEQQYSASFTDCASVFESAGNSIFLTEGNPENIKITTPYDLAIAEIVSRV